MACSDRGTGTAMGDFPGASPSAERPFWRDALPDGHHYLHRDVIEGCVASRPVCAQIHPPLLTERESNRSWPSRPRPKPTPTANCPPTSTTVRFSSSSAPDSGPQGQLEHRGTPLQTGARGLSHRRARGAARTRTFAAAFSLPAMDVVVAANSVDRRHLSCGSKIAGYAWTSNPGRNPSRGAGGASGRQAPKRRPNRGRQCPVRRSLSPRSSPGGPLRGGRRPGNLGGSPMSHRNVVRGSAVEGPLARPAQTSAGEPHGMHALLSGAPSCAVTALDARARRRVRPRSERVRWSWA